MITTKEDVFQVMGEYYGNAYYRSALKLGISESDLITTVQILNQINALGYHFSNLHRLLDHEDIRFLPIILDYIDRYENPGYKAELIHAFHCRSYSPFTPNLISLYRQPAYKNLQFEISNALYDIRSKKYISLYLGIVEQPEYGTKPDLIMEILCKFKVKECLPLLLNLLDHYPEVWRVTFLKYAYCFDPDLILPHIELFLDSSDKDIRLMANKAYFKLMDKKGG